VETPFISHLLDLPFGTYIFKEDGGIRKIIPPPTPVSTELSLTNGVEVDVDKFLSPDIDLISLPHLTNLDFASICNE
jgi:CRISPR/Cas system CMR-associated protein Cmr3 (group 5 of RAMP superfamily)